MARALSKGEAVIEEYLPMYVYIVCSLDLGTFSMHKRAL